MWECAECYAWRKLEEKVVLLDTTSGQYTMMNETASTIWEALMSGNSQEQAADLLAEAYDVPLDDARRDVDELLTKFRADGFLVESAN